MKTSQKTLACLEVSPIEIHYDRLRLLPNKRLRETKLFINNNPSLLYVCVHKPIQRNHLNTCGCITKGTSLTTYVKEYWHHTTNINFYLQILLRYKLYIEFTIMKLQNWLNDYIIQTVGKKNRSSPTNMLFTIPTDFNPQMLGTAISLAATSYLFQSIYHL